MVIVIMGDSESIPESVGAAIAESLGWEFLDIKKQFASCKSGAGIGGGQAQFVETLGAVLDSSIYHWRDVVVSSPVLAERDQKHLRDNRLLVKFVQLKAPDETDSNLRWNFPPEETTCVPANTVGPTRNCHEGTLTLASSMEMSQIIDAVLSLLVLRRRRNDIDAA